MKKLLAIFSLLALVLSACGSDGSGGSGDSGGSMTIGAQTYTETKIMAHMYKALIEDQTDISVAVKPDLATSPVVIEAMQAGDVHMSTQYTGTALAAFFSIEHPKDPEATLEQAQEDFAGEDFNFKWFDALGFENTYALAVTKDLADEHGLETISDLQGLAGDMTAAFDTSWLERENDGYDAFSEMYGFEFGETLPMEIGLVYDAVKNGEVDIALAYSTDARIEAYDLVILEDDEQFFPPYDACPVIKQETLDEHPEIADVIEPLLGALDVSTMGQLNGKVDLDGEDVEDVAVNYLKEQGLLE